MTSSRYPKKSPEELFPAVMDRPPLTDLRSITRRSDRCLTRVTLKVDWDRKNDTKWLVFGEAQLRQQRESQADTKYRLEAYLSAGTTDFEHDSAYALRLPLIGLHLDCLAVRYSVTNLVAWVDPNCPEDFHVPMPGYDPTKLAGSHVCKNKACEGHVIVPEEYWVPPFEPDLYRMVRGKQVEITIGPVISDDQ